MAKCRAGAAGGLYTARTAGGGIRVQVFLHLVRLIDVGGSQSGKADDRIHPKKQILFRNENGKQKLLYI